MEILLGVLVFVVGIILRFAYLSVDEKAQKAKNKYYDKNDRDREGVVTGIGILIALIVNIVIASVSASGVLGWIGYFLLGVILVGVPAFTLIELVLLICSIVKLNYYKSPEYKNQMERVRQTTISREKQKKIAVQKALNDRCLQWYNKNAAYCDQYWCSFSNKCMMVSLDELKKIHDIYQNTRNIWADYVYTKEALNPWVDDYSEVRRLIAEFHSYNDELKKLAKKLNISPIETSLHLSQCRDTLLGMRYIENILNKNHVPYYKIYHIPDELEYYFKRKGV